MNLILINTIILIFCTIKNINADECEKFKTCGECIGNPNNCLWCLDKKVNGSKCRSQLDTTNSTGCNKIYDPMFENPTEIKIIKNMPLKSAGKRDTDNVQFRPQNIRIKVRPGVPVEFTLSYKPAKDYPLDVYYLMDNTYTMEFQKDKLRDQAKAIHDKLSKITNNVQFGVGSYVEKSALPYSKSGYNGYAFRNHLSLTDDIELFSKVINDTEALGNYDTPEDALDGLMQAIVCEAEIKWRPDARRIIVLSTDSPYHSAGDGKMVGAYKPNDMKCHLKNNTYGKESLIYDYPSVSQINKIAYEKRVSILFAALKSVKNVYEELVKNIRESEYVELSHDSYIPEIIQKLYMTQVQKLRISKNNLPEHVNLILDPPCSEDNPKDFKVGETVHIQATLNVTKCPKDGKVTQFSIGPTKLKDTLDIQLEVICECNCEKESMHEHNSVSCNKLGSLQCGACKCNNGSYGKTCECHGTSTEELDLKKCGENNYRRHCSGRGVCNCGKCECKHNYYGEYCEFNIKDCPFYLGEPCGGHGICNLTMRRCLCEEGWSGETCACNDMACVGPNLKICSGHGECQCGKCKCRKDEANNRKYIGKYCNFCEGCTDERCVDLGNFVECYYQTRGLCNDQLKDPHEVYMMKQSEINSKFPKTHRCKRILEDGSFIVYLFVDTNEKTIITIQEEKELPPVTDTLVVVGSAIGAILIIGLVTVVFWKLLVDYHDKKEYERFLNQVKEEGYDLSEHSQNPIYQPPSTTIRNPAYEN